MSSKTQDIATAAINKIVLKCQVKQTINHAPIPHSKLMQKVTLLPSPSLSPSKHQQTRQQQAEKSVCKGNSQFSRGAYQHSLKEYTTALSIYAKIPSKQYYRTLARMIECQKKMRNYRETMRLYQELSLVEIGHF